MVRARVTFFLLFILIYSASNALTIKGTFLNTSGEGLQSITVLLRQLPDSSIRKMTATNQEGNFELTEILPGAYFLQATSPAYSTHYSDIVELKDDYDFSKITLKESSKKLKEVDIVAQKPLIENKPGKIVVNVEALISAAGKTAFDILEQSPNITIDRNSNIRMRGKQGVIVMIDGKRTPMSGEDLANFLRSLPANAVEKIEIITNPSSKYDAAGNAGIINIIMKKDKRLGTNGTVTLSGGHGRYYKMNNGISVNNRNKKLNVFGSYNLSYRKGFNDLALYRKFYAADTLQGAYNQFNGLIFPFNNHLVRTGIDYSITPRTTIGFSANGVVNRFNPYGLNNTKVLNQTEQVVSTFSTTNRSKDLWGNYSANLYLKHTLDSAGSELTMDLDYANYGNKTIQNFTTNYLDLAGQELRNTYLLYGDIHGNLSIRSAKMDYTHPLSKEAKLEAGLKSSYVTADNDLKFYDRSDGTLLFDSAKSNHFIYGENINAAYINYSATLGVYNIQLGLRAEQTNVKGEQKINGQTFRNSYAQLFPNLAIEKEFSKKYSAGFSLSRRIDRPSYEQLNPFKFFLDPTTYKEGNPYLLPQLSYNTEFTQTFIQKIVVTLGYSITNRLITEVLVPAENASNITVQTNVNLARYDYAGVSLSAPFHPFKWWNSVNNANVYYGYYRGFLAHTNLSNGSPAFDVNSNNSFLLKNNWSAEFNLFYNSGQVYAFMRTKRSWMAGVGIQKTFHERRGTVKLSMNDIFWTGIAAGQSKFRDYDEVFLVRRDTRAVFLTLTYKFGKSTVAPARRRAGGAETEKQRANKSGN